MAALIIICAIFKVLLYKITGWLVTCKYLEYLYNFFYRDGCRPFVEVFQGEDKVFTSIDDYERLKVFTTSHAKVISQFSYNL